MKRNMKKMLAAVMAVSLMLAPIAALAESEEGAAPEAEVKVEEKKEEKKKEEKAEAPKPEEKKEEKAAEPEEKKEEKAEAPEPGEKKEEQPAEPEPAKTEEAAPDIEFFETEWVMIDEYRALGSVFSNEIAPEEAQPGADAGEAGDPPAQESVPEAGEPAGEAAEADGGGEPSDD